MICVKVKIDKKAESSLASVLFELRLNTFKLFTRVHRAMGAAYKLK